MTPEDELKAARLAEDRHLEVVGLLKELIGAVTLATSTVVHEHEADPAATAQRIEHVIKEVTD